MPSMETLTFYLSDSASDVHGCSQTTSRVHDWLVRQARRTLPKSTRLKCVTPRIFFEDRRYWLSRPRWNKETEAMRPGFTHCTFSSSSDLHLRHLNENSKLKYMYSYGDDKNIIAIGVLLESRSTAAAL